MADESTRKRKRFSKNKKKYWKKHADVNDVEEYLEDQRLQERTGGIVAEKPDSDIFFVDVTNAKQETTDVPAKRRRKEPKPLKCHSALLPNPKIKPIKVSHNIKRHKVPQNTGPLKVTPKVVERLTNQEQARNARMERRKQPKLPEPSFDLWTETDVKQTSSPDDDIAPNDHYLRVMKSSKIKKPVTSLKKPSQLPAVEPVHPGASYNPDYDEHQDLLQKAFLVEVKKEKEEKRITRALDDMFPTAGNAPTEVSMRNELAEGLFDESDSDSEGSDEELSALSVNPPVRREDKKTETTRKKEAKQQEEKLKAQKLKAERIRKNEIFRIKSVKKEVQELLTTQKVRKEKKKRLAEQNATKTKRLGKNKFEEPEMEIKLSDELQGSLRQLKPEGHVLEDRFKSLQKRNIIEPRGRAKKTRKYKRKTFVKKSHKEDV